jgi:8-oxo-dGTP diphosphatase
MSSPNVWEFPGGKMEGDEKPEETLQREIEEELGCVIDVGRLVADTTERTSSGLLIRLQTYEARLKLGQPRAKDHASLLWLPVPYLRSLLWSPPDLPTIDVLMSELEK